MRRRINDNDICQCWQLHDMQVSCRRFFNFLIHFCIICKNRNNLRVKNKRFKQIIYKYLFALMQPMRGDVTADQSKFPFYLNMQNIYRNWGVNRNRLVWVCI